MLRPSTLTLNTALCFPSGPTAQSLDIHHHAVHGLLPVQSQIPCTPVPLTPIVTHILVFLKVVGLTLWKTRPQGGAAGVVDPKDQCPSREGHRQSPHGLGFCSEDLRLSGNHEQPQLVSTHGGPPWWCPRADTCLSAFRSPLWVVDVQFCLPYHNMGASRGCWAVACPRMGCGLNYRMTRDGEAADSLPISGWSL